MSNLLNKYNTFYFIASSLATLTLLTSLALINVPSSLILALAALSALALMILYKIIIDTKKVGKEFAHKERELEKKITLAANKEIGILKNQLRELTQEKYNLYEEAEKFSIQPLWIKIQRLRESIEC